MNVDPKERSGDKEDDRSVLYRIGSKIKSIQSTIERSVMLVNRERTSGSEFDVPLRRRLWLWRHGFLTEADVYFDLSDETVGEFLTDYQRDVKTKDINGRTGRILDDKIAFHQLFSDDCTEYLPDLYAYLSADRVYSIDLDDRVESREALLERLPEGKGVVCKPRVGGGGEGIYVIDRTEKGFQINDRFASLSDVNELLATFDEYLIFEKVQQAEYAERVFSGSTNTIRVLTMIDPDSGEPFVGGVSHRFGAKSSAPVDNRSSGGMTSAIDLETETLGPAIRWTSKRGTHWMDDHPDTGAKITGTTIPNWGRIITVLLQIAEQYPYLPYIGWDIVVTGKNGEFKIIEGNRYSGTRALQPHQPLLTDEQTRRFYKYHGIIDR